jgi:hypothetical protein
MSLSESWCVCECFEDVFSGGDGVGWSQEFREALALLLELNEPEGDDGDEGDDGERRRR